MNLKARLTVAAATLVLVAGCTSLRHKEKPPRVQGQLPGAPQPRAWCGKLDRSRYGRPDGLADVRDGTGVTPEKSKFGFSEITPGL